MLTVVDATDSRKWVADVLREFVNYAGKIRLQSSLRASVKTYLKCTIELHWRPPAPR